MNDSETFSRLIYLGVTQLQRSEREVLLLPLGYLLDQIEIHYQFMSISKRGIKKTIDDVIPAGI